MKTTFEEDTLAVLKNYVSETADGRSPRSRRNLGWKTWTAIGGTAAAAATAAVVALVLQPGPAAAYNVEAGSGGLVTVAIHTQRDAAGLERRLSELGVRAHVTYLSLGKICQFDQYHPANNMDRVLVQRDSSVSRRDPNTLFALTINKKAMLSSQSVIIQLSGFDKQYLDRGTILTAVADGPVAACRPTSVPGGPSHHPSPDPSPSPSSD